jgi:prepilin peptidase CpaA
MSSSLLLSGLALGLVVAAVTDVRDGRIPNWLTVSLAIFGIGVQSWEHGWDGFLFSLGGLGIGLACLMFFYIKGGMGAGDVKLLGAIGTILGPGQVVLAFACAAMLGGLYSLALLSNQGGSATCLGSGVSHSFDLEGDSYPSGDWWTTHKRTQVAVCPGVRAGDRDCPNHVLLWRVTRPT